LHKLINGLGLGLGLGLLLLVDAGQEGLISEGTRYLDNAGKKGLMCGRASYLGRARVRLMVIVSNGPATSRLWLQTIQLQILLVRF